MGCWAHLRAYMLLPFACFLGSVFTSVALNFPGTTSCQDDKWQVWLPEELVNLSSWKVDILDGSGEEMGSCDYQVDYGKQMLMAGYQNCTEIEDNKHRLRFRLLHLNQTVVESLRNETYSLDCDTTQADASFYRSGFTSATNCTQTFMAVMFPRLIPTLDEEYLATASQREWMVSVEEDAKTHQWNLQQAIQQGYTFLSDENWVIIQVPFDAKGVTAYKQDGRVLYTVALKLTYGPPEQRLTMESRMICAPGPAICNSTHMMITVPAFPGRLAAVELDEKSIPVHQLQARGIGVDLRRGIKLSVSKRLLKTRAYRDDNCLGFQSYASPLKLSFDYRGETATMISSPECPCEQNAPIAATCTQDGHMDFEITSSSTKPALDLDTLKLRDPTCGPVFRSPSNDRVRFRVPLDGCGTRPRMDGEKMVYENEVSASWADQPPRWISRDSEFRLTVVCFYGSDDALLNAKINTPPVPESVVKQGPISLILLIYPDDSYVTPYSDDQYPIVKYLRQPIFLEVQVLHRDDPNIHLMLDDCWATQSSDSASLPRWDIVVDGCEYQLDNYKTIFHSMGPEVSYSNFRQRFEVKAFAFVSASKALSSLVYFHCSVIICDRLSPDSPLCSAGCPRIFRNRREAAAEKSVVVSLPHAVILIPEEQFDMQGRQKLSSEMWITTVSMALAALAFLCATAFGVLTWFRKQKGSGLIS